METKEVEKQENTENMAKQEMIKVWMNFDLAFRGDFESLYRYLDKLKAIECGSELAYFELPPKKDFVNHLKSDIAKNIQLQKSDRLYVIINYKDKTTSGFLFGGRKRANWIGYSVEDTPDIIDIL